jgi:AbiV family abortive infection protein
VLAIDIPARNIRPYASQLIQLSRQIADVQLRYRKSILPLKYANEKDLKDFLSYPERSPFVVASKLVLGIQLCLDNAISLTITSDVSASSQPVHAMFFTYTALEELGKAAILVDALKKAPQGAAYIEVDGFTNHTAKLLRAVEGLAGEVVLTGKHSAKIVDGALRSLDQAGRLLSGNKGAIAFHLLYRRLVRNFGFLRDMGEFFRDSAIYVDYDGLDKSWEKPRTRFSATEINELNETIREFSKEYKSKLNPPDVSQIPKLEQVLPTGWFNRLARK